MPAEEPRDLPLEIGHVLFVDIVGYSKLLINEQSELLEHLKEMVRGSGQVRAADAEGKLIRLATGDGMALVFRNNPEAPAQCALELSRADKRHLELQLRMGIHSGPINIITDVNERANVTGAGINMAQRVMDCGDAGHILLSKRAADDLAQYRHWQPRLHDLGEVEVKHGVTLSLVNLYTGTDGNREPPDKLRRAREQQTTKVRTASRRRRMIVLIGIAALVLALAALVAWVESSRHAQQLVPSSAAEKVTPPAVAIGEKSIAVLPFENLSAEKDDAFFADGIQDDVLTSLGKIKELTVIGRNSVMSYRGAAVGGKLREIGKTLGVAHVLQGSVRRSANRVVINVQLIDTKDEHQRWTERYERTMTDALTLQGELAVEIARELRATLSPTEKSVVAAKPTENPEAYLLYLRAREIENRLGPSEEELAAAIKLYREAIEHDPKFALARARLSLRISSQQIFNSVSPEGKEALAQAEEALRLNPNLGEARIALAGYRLWCQSEFEPALAELARAEELLPNSSEVWRMRAMIYKRQGKLRERIAALQRGETLDPLDTNNPRMLFTTFSAMRQWPEAIRMSTGSLR